MNKKLILGMLIFFLLAVSVNAFTQAQINALQDGNIFHLSGDNVTTSAKGTGKGLNTTSSWGDPTGVTGVVGNAMDFDGDDGIKSFDRGLVTGVNLTVGAWIYADTHVGGNYIVSRTQTGGNSLDYLLILTSGKVKFEGWNGSTWISTIEDNVSMDTGTWYHVIATNNGTHANIYINGTNVKSGTGWTLPGNSANTIGVGMRTSLNDKFFNGTIDEPFVLNKTLSQSEITALYNSGSGVNNMDAHLSNLVYYNNLDYFSDLSSSGVQGSGFQGSGSSEESSAVGSNSYYFDGDAGIKFGDVLPLNSSDNVSMSAWINTETQSGNDFIIARTEDGGNEDNYYMRLTDGKLLCGGWNGATWVETIEDSLTMSTDTWYHVACTNDGTTTRLFIDGDNVKNGTGWTLDESPISTFAVGMKSQYFDGYIDEPSVYNRALNTTEITWLSQGINPYTATSTFLGCTDSRALNYNSTAVDDDGSCVYDLPTQLKTNILAFYDFDDNYHVYDVTKGSPDRHEMDQDTRYFTSYPQRYYEIDGLIGRAVNLSEVATFRWTISPTTPTYAFWVKNSDSWDYTGNEHYLFNGGDFSNYVALRQDGDGNYSFIVDNGGATFTTSLNHTDMKWQSGWNFVVIYTDGASSYLNINNQSVTNHGVSLPSESSKTYCFGGSGASQCEWDYTYGSGNFSYDEFYFYDAQLTAAQINTLYNNGAGVSSPDTTNLVLWDEMHMFGDSSGNNNYMNPSPPDNDPIYWYYRDGTYAIKDGSLLKTNKHTIRANNEGAVSDLTSNEIVSLAAWYHPLYSVDEWILYTDNSTNRFGMKFNDASGDILEFHANGVNIQNVTFAKDATQANHYALTADGSNLKFYYNGVLNQTIAHTGTVGAGDFLFASYQGVIDDIGLWDDTLSGDEVLYLYSGTSGNESIYNEDDSQINITLSTPTNASNTSTLSQIDFVFTVTNTTDLHTLSSVDLYINGTLNQTNTSGTWGAYNFSIASMTAGSYEYNVVATNNYSKTYNSSTYTFEISEVYPTFASLTESPSDPQLYGIRDYTFGVDITNTNGTAGIVFDGVNYTMTNVSATFSKTLSNLSPSVYQYYYWSYSNTAHYNNTINYTYTVTADTEDPNATLLLPANDTTYQTTYYNLTANLTDNSGIDNATIYVYNSSNDLINETYVEVTDTVVQQVINVVLDLVDDVYTWFVTIFDISGNTETTANQTFTIDDTLTINAYNYTSSGLVSNVTWHNNVTGVTYNGSTYTLDMSPYVNQTNANYLFNITAVDNSGFYLNYSAIYNVSVGNFNYNISMFGPTPEVISKVYDDQDNLETDLLDLSGEIDDDLYLELTGISNSDFGGNITISIVNASGTSVLSETISSISTGVNRNSSTFTLSDYSVHNYTIIITNNQGKGTTYTGQLNATNIAPVLSTPLTRKGPVFGGCAKDTACSLYIDITEDGCEQPSTQSVVIKEVDSGTTKVSDSSLIFISEYSKNKCYLETDAFLPVNTGSHNYSISYTDSQGEVATKTGIFIVAAPTGSAPSGGGGGGGGGDTIIIVGSNLTSDFAVTPISADVRISPGDSREIEFEVENLGVEDTEITLEILDSSISEWMNFGDDLKELTIEVEKSQGLTSNKKFVRYFVDVPDDVSLGLYSGKIAIDDGDNYKIYTIEVEVSQPFADFLSGEFTDELFFLGGEVCADDAFSTTTTCTETKKVGISVSFLTITLTIITGFAIAGIYAIAFKPKTPKVKKRK